MTVVPVVVSVKRWPIVILVEKVDLLMLRYEYDA